MDQIADDKMQKVQDQLASLGVRLGFAIQNGVLHGHVIVDKNTTAPGFR